MRFFSLLRLPGFTLDLSFRGCGGCGGKCLPGTVGLHHVSRYLFHTVASILFHNQISDQFRSQNTNIALSPSGCGGGCGSCGGGCGGKHQLTATLNLKF